MPTIVPESAWTHKQEEIRGALGEVLDALLEFMGASAGWVGLVGPDGRLFFPVQRGQFAERWLSLQQGQVWGVEVRGGPTILNDLPSLPLLGDPPLRTLLSCPLPQGALVSGQVVLTNKPSGFTSLDAAVLQGFVHLVSKRLQAILGQRSPEIFLSGTLAHRTLNRMKEGILIFDEQGMLLFANSSWFEWTSFQPEEILGKPAPFSFWISHRDLAALGGSGNSLPAALSSLDLLPSGSYPFRRRNGTVFWCQVESTVERHEGRSYQIAVLQLIQPTIPSTIPREILSPIAEELPFAVVLTDLQGHIVWANTAFHQLLAPTNLTPGQPLHECFTTASAAAVEHFIHLPPSIERSDLSRLILQRRSATGTVHDFVTYAAASTHGFLFAFREDWGALCADDELMNRGHGESRPNIDWLVLLLRPGRDIDFWDERWEKLTGLNAADLAGVPCEVVLDWLFPRQRDRERVADMLHQPVRSGAQAILNVLTRTGSRPMLCTFLPANGQNQERWLWMTGDVELLAGDGATAPSLRFVRQFTQGLSRLLNHYFTPPIGLAELALERNDLPGEVSSWFSQILDSCHRGSSLIASLQDLGALDAGETQVLSLAVVVQAFVDEWIAELRKNYSFTLDTQDAQTPVRVNRRMLQTVLRHLCRNAEQALTHSPRQHIAIRVYAREDAACCEIQDTGEGLPTEDWTKVLEPFYSTKGPFARDPAHAAIEATGLGLTVSQHLLMLHGGRLEMQSLLNQGTIVTMILPRADRVPPASAAPGVREVPPIAMAAPTGCEILRADVPTESRGPHSVPTSSPARKPPEDRS